MLFKPFRTLSSVILFTQISQVLSFGCGTAPDNEIATSDNATVFRRQDDGVEATCQLPAQDPSSKRSLQPVVSTSLSRRQGPKKKKPAKEPQPLEEPGGTDDELDEFFDKFVKSERHRGGTQLNIFPGDIQLANWKIEANKKDVPIGATGVYHPFGKNKENFVMQGLTGCTAIIVVSKNGIYAGHLWEGSETVGGGSSFNERLSEDTTRVRGKNEFEKIAVNIWDTPLPTGDRRGVDPKTRPSFQSLPDVATHHDAPFDVGDVEVFILTKANSANQRREPLYKSQITSLVSKFKGRTLFPESKGATHTLKTYQEYDQDVVTMGRGVIAVQYTPFQEMGGDDGCSPQARVRVYAQGDREPVIEKTWDATSKQVSGKRRRDASCSLEGDWPVTKGYVAFGDSFAAGMGTGITGTGSCRIGTANVGDLINAHNPEGIDYQRKMCSGDTTTGLNRQIKEWKNPQNADIATVTMGGNDLGFSEIVKFCVIRFSFWSTGYVNKMCKQAKDKANAMMNDVGKDGIGYKLGAAYKDIVEKSTRDDFHLYVSGYPGGFFNAEDLQPMDCKHTLFDIQNTAYCPDRFTKCWNRDNIWLTVALRQELNGLVLKLNNVTQAAVEQVNKDIGSDQVHFVDVSPYFDGHRWCEANDDPNVHEPNPDNPDTWYFLSAWKDVDASTILSLLPGDGAANNATNDAVEAQSLMEQGGVELPDAEICEEDLGTDPDPWAKWLCWIAQDIAENPDSPWAEKLKEANDDIAAQDFQAESITWWYPMRQIKTFHPRTPGMHAYRDSIIDAVNKVAAGTWTESTSSLNDTRAPMSGSDAVCYSTDDFPDHGAVDPGTVSSLADEVCDTFRDKFLSADTGDKWYQEHDVDGVLYQYGVTWIESCDSTRMKLPGTIETDDLDNPTCQSLFNKAFEDCNNGGIGGYVDVTCARYTFSGGKKADDEE